MEVEILTQKTYIILDHRYGFRVGEPAEILDFKWVKLSENSEWRLAFEVMYFDGLKEYIQYSDVISGKAVIISDVDLANERITINN